MIRTKVWGRVLNNLIRHIGPFLNSITKFSDQAYAKTLFFVCVFTLVQFSRRNLLFAAGALSKPASWYKTKWYLRFAPFYILASCCRSEEIRCRIVSSLDTLIIISKRFTCLWPWLVISKFQRCWDSLSKLLCNQSGNHLEHVWFVGFSKKKKKKPFERH